MKTNQSKPEFWQGHIASWKASGTTQAAYCKQENLKAHQLAYWKNLLEEKTIVRAQEKSSGFVQVKSGSPRYQGLRITTASGNHIDGINESNILLVKSLLGGEL